MSLQQAAINCTRSLRASNSPELETRESLSIRCANLSQYKKDIRIELVGIANGYDIASIHNLVNSNGKFTEDYMKKNTIRLYKKYN